MRSIIPTGGNIINIPNAKSRLHPVGFIFLFSKFNYLPLYALWLVLVDGVSSLLRLNCLYIPPFSS